MSHQVVFITGANSGIGRVTALGLLKRGWHVVLGVRKPEACDALLMALSQELRESGRLTALELDLSDLRSVQQCAKNFLELNLPLHALILNAGIAGQHGATAQGFELAFGVNHLGHFLLTQLLTQKLCDTKSSRVVTVASRAHRYAHDGINWDNLQRPTRSLFGVQEYAVSKLANIWFSNHLSRRLMGTGVSTYALHPGVVRTGIWRNAPAWTRPLLSIRPMLDVDEGAKTTLYCTLDAPQSETGLYYVDGSVAKAASIAYSLDDAALLWSKSQYFCRAFL